MAFPKPEAPPMSYSQVIPLRIQVQLALQDYFHQLGEQAPANLYKLVMEEVEQPLLESAMRYTRGNQTRAAEILGINRSTLRKKLKHYHLE
ncbi:MAG: DNA-binding transcriptional regulator Fis [Candidatus Competibacteraceae bacterium]|jgi:Fis family transcriptional regulator|nr:DNA-binding transcriptional regulator Fis [Candidatus Competibacteraceae bacterium]